MTTWPGRLGGPIAGRRLGVIVEDDLSTKSWRAGEGRLRMNHVQADDSAKESVRSVEGQASDTQAASGLLMCLVALMLFASAGISLTLLWFAIRGIQWLLLR